MLKNLMQTRRVRYCGLLIVGLLTALFIWHLATRSEPSLAHRFTPGKRLVYRLEYLSASASDFAGLTDDAKDAQAIHTNVEANLHATVVEADGDGALIAFTWEAPDVNVVVDGGLAITQAETIRDDLSRTVLASVDARGRIRAVHFDPRTTSLSHAFARSLLAAMQVALPDDKTQTAWETTEHDPNGVCTVRYQRHADDADFAVIRKERTRYEAKVRSNSIRTLDVDSVTQPSGSVTIRFDQRAGRAESLEGREATVILLNGKTVARAETNLKMTFLREETANDADRKALQAACARLKAEPAVALSTPGMTSAQTAAIHRNELGDATLDGVLNELAHLDANASDTQLYFKLKALVYLRPEACPQLGQVLSAAGAKTRTFQLLTDALSTVGHTQAQAALGVAIRERREDAAALAVLVPALAMVEAPAPESEEILRDLAVNSPHATVRESAELGLGTMAHQMADAAPERSLGIARAMAAKLKDASSDETRRHLLLVLGNAGVAETFDAVVPFLKSSAPEVRSAAAAALRWMKTAQADHLLCGVLAADADASVRVEAATALGFRTMTAANFDAHKAAFVKDESSSVRVAVLQNIARARTAFPEGQRILTTALADSSEAVRDEAAGLLVID